MLYWYLEFCLIWATAPDVTASRCKTSEPFPVARGSTLADHEPLNLARAEGSGPAAQEDQ
jgi:hypothetical protein